MAVILTILAAACLLFVFLLYRAARFLPPQETPEAAEPVEIDGERAVSRLREMIRCRTVSVPGERDNPEKARFRQLLPALYPRVFSICQTERVDETGLLLRWRGTEPGEPAVFLSHYDVVPAQAEAWEKPPFEGVLEDGVLWGRGTLDMKNQLCGVLEAMDHLMARGFVPRHDIYFALSGEEEIMGPTAERIRDLFADRGITPAFVVDEGGDIMTGVFPGTEAVCAMVGIGEKGVGNLYFTARGPGGHASVPFGENPLERLTRAVVRIEKLRFPQRPCKALEAMVDTMGRYCPFSTRLLLANRDLLRPLYLRWLRRQGGMLLAASRTTFALTRASGSQTGNVIPSEAEMYANARLLWGDTTASLAERLRKTVRDPAVEIRAEGGAEPRPDSEMARGWQELRRAIRQTWPEAVVTPYLMVATTDSRYWRDICPSVYRFSAKAVTGAEKATVHGNNERIRVENVPKTAEFFLRLMAQL